MDGCRYPTHRWRYCASLRCPTPPAATLRMALYRHGCCTALCVPVNPRATPREPPLVSAHLYPYGLRCLPGIQFRHAFRVAVIAPMGDAVACGVGLGGCGKISEHTGLAGAHSFVEKAKPMEYTNRCSNGRNRLSVGLSLYHACCHRCRYQQP